uniref:calcium-binding and coiled-coil domain-containing protein 2 isoform X1 n=1 Tax=Centroberyx gerrardi TaxID=166262 RepID=UPI003AABD72D
MENSSEVVVLDSSAASFSQVLFNDIPHSYPPAASVTCHYTLTAAFQPNTRDWVGIFKVGWSTTKDYHTFVWVEPSLDVVGQETARKQAVFRDYYLPKDEAEFYQFCYIDSNGQVRGASTPFCFKTPVEQSMECSLENDLLVITTQEQVEQSVREKAELMKELDQMREENESIKSALKDKQQQVDSLEEQNEQREQERSDLVKELNQMKEQNEGLIGTLKEQQQENDQLKEEVLIQLANRLEIQQQNASEQENLSQSVDLGDESSRQQEQSLTHVQEKYDRAVIKIKQLKEEREELRGKIDIQSVEISELKRKTRDREQELLKLKDTIQLLKVDVQSSEKEKERLSAELHRLHSLTHNLDEVKRENRELRRSLSEQETLQNIPDDDLKVQTLVSQLQEARAQLGSERQESNTTKRRAEQLEREVLEVREQLQNVATSSDKTQRKSGKLELQLTEAHGIIADKDGLIEEQENIIMLEKHEKEELARENQNLKRDIEGLRREFADLQAAPPADSLPVQPSTPPGSPAHFIAQGQQQDAPPDSHQYEDLYDELENAPDTGEEHSLMCRHCQEHFPGITQDELVQHEQSHRVCPFCTLICDGMEQSVFEDHVYSHEL